MLCAVSAHAVQPISGILAAYDSVTNTNDDFAAAGGGTGDFPSGTTYNMRFNVGSQNNLYLTGFEIGDEVYNFVLLAEIINIERVDNLTTTGRHHIVLYEQSSVSGTNVHLKSGYAHTMEEALRSPIVNRGADNVFANTGDGNANNNNIQRIDYIFPDGFPVFNNIDQRGFLIMDRGGNDRFKITAITALDANGKPSVFTDPVTVWETDWGDSGIMLDTIVMRGYTEDGGVQHPSANVSPQPLSGVFITWQALGLETNDFIYGYSLAAGDVTNDGAFWTEVDNTAYFPTNTSPAAHFGGLDLISGGMMFFEADMDVTIGDFVWDDWNGDGIQDPGEPGISNVLVHVYDANTNLASVTRTDHNGFWLAQGIGPGDFFVEFFLPTGYQFTVQYAGTNTAVDSNADPVTGRSEVFTIGAGQTNRTIDAGMHLAPGDLRLEKSVAPDAVKRGDEVVYTVVVTNVGPEIVNLVQVTDPLPAAVAFEGYGASQGTYDDGAALWDIGTLGLGASAMLTVTGTVHGGYGCSIITNTAEITRMDRPDTNTADNVDSATFYIECADLAVTKAVDNDQPLEGEAIEFTVTLTNLGPDDAEDIELTDLLPAGLTFSNAAPSQGSYNDGTGIWSVGPVTNGGSAALILTAVPDPGTGGTMLTNTATITASSHDDPDPDNNEDSAVILVRGADLAVTKIVNKPAASEGDTVIYTITVENLGPSDTTGVEVTDPLVAGVTYTDDTPSQGSYNSGTGVWTVGALAVGSNATLQIEATVDVGTMGQTLTNTAAVTASDLPDPNPANDQDSAEVFVSSLEITKTSDVAGFASPGDTITYTIVITNSGATAETYERITRVPGSHARAWRGIRRLLDAGIRVELKTILMTLNEQEREAMAAQAADLGLTFRHDAAIFPCLPDGSTQPLDLRVSPETAVAHDLADPKRRDQWRNVIEMSEKTSPGDRLYTCGAGASHFYCDPYGNLSPCLITTRYRYAQGNRPFHELWRNELGEIRGKRRTRSDTLLAGPLRGACAHCPAVNYLETGDEEQESDFMRKTTLLRYQTAFTVPAEGARYAERERP